MKRFLLFQLILKQSQVRYLNRNQTIRSVWNIAFYAASVVFLHLYHGYVLSPDLDISANRLFPIYENTIFHKSPECDIFRNSAIFILAFYLHWALQALKDGDIIDASVNTLFSLAQITLISYR